jgi:glutaredoxin
MIHLYIINGCPFCHKAELLLNSLKLRTNRITVEISDKYKYKKRNKMNTFPQIFYIKDKKEYKIGGLDELEYLISIVEIKKKFNFDNKTLSFFEKNI